MAYLPLSRKYRPQNFDEVVYQDFVVDTLKNAIELGKVAHSYLFTGPRGVGKTSLARILSKAVNCLNPNGLNPCNECDNCKEITNGTSMDVVEIDGASNRGIDEIRQLRENVKFVSVKCKYKVYIIDEVHMLTDAAFNALLKTLEEPPSFVIFILATTDAHKVPATILSRCQKFDFKKIPHDFMYQYLQTILEKEGIVYEKDAINIVIRNSEGCMRDALSLIDQIVAFGGNKITYKDTLFLLGMSDRKLIESLFENVIEENPDKVYEIIAEIDSKGVNFQFVLKTLIEIIRTLLFALSKGGKFENSLTDDEKRFYSALLPKVTEQKLFVLFQIVQKTLSDIKNFAFPGYIFEFGMYKACKISEILPVSNAGIVKDNVQIKKPSAVKNVSQPESKEEGVEDKWNSFLKKLAEIKPGLAANLSHGFFSSFVNGKLTVGFSEDKKFHYDFTTKRENFNIAKEMLLKYDAQFKDFEIVMENGSKKKALIEKIYEAETFQQRKLRQEAESDEVVKMFKMEFDCVIEDIKLLKKPKNPLN
jgi:DNA polymerase-3 subunit gamma/tau